MKKLNLGCGKKIKPDFINLDVLSLPGVDIVHNLESYPYPFAENTFDYIYCDNVLEHLSDTVKTIEELYRIAKPNALIEIIVPYFSSHCAFADPTHKHYFTYTTIDYFTDNNPYNFYSSARFTIKKKLLIFPKIFKVFEKIFNKTPRIYEHIFCHTITAVGLNIQIIPKK